MKPIQRLCLLSCLLTLLFSCGSEKLCHIYFDPAVPQVKFAVRDLIHELQEDGLEVELKPLEDFQSERGNLSVLITHHLDLIDSLCKQWNTSLPEAKKSQSYSIRVKGHGRNRTLAVLAGDANGAMYGAMDLAEAVKLGTWEEIAAVDREPYVEKRGIKFNISLDMRTPTYSSYNDAVQQNIPEMWSMEFWTEMLDHLARNRFNVISLWNLHPFPSMVKVPEFPDVALEDVFRELEVNSPRSNHAPVVITENNHEILKKITIEEKIRFWQEVMRYGRDRGISFQLFTWNIFTHGSFGQYGINDEQDNETTLAYFRASTRELALSYPLLEGIGVTAGEHMQNLKGEYSNENWLWKAYGEGVRDAKKFNPDLEIQLIHRFHLASQSEILEAWKDYPGEFNFSFKYLYAHMFSDTKSVFVEPALKYLAPGVKMWLELRNDDIYSFRWGDPDFARDFVLNLPSEEKFAGYYLGSDGYCLGREFLSTEPETPRQLVMKKQWYLYMLFGRLSFDPSIPNEHFQKTLAHRFPEVPADKMYTASSEASKIFPEVTRFFWGDIDVRWFPEACKKVDRFYNIHDFIMQTTMPGTDNINIKVWRGKKLRGEEIIGKTPFEVAASLEGYANRTLELLKDLREIPSDNKELRLTLGDYEAFAHLGNYYAEKIRGATYIALYDSTGIKAEQDSAVLHLEKALDHWQSYSAIYTLQNVQPVLWGRSHIVDIPGQLSLDVARDIEMAKNWEMGSVKGPLVRRKELNFKR